MKTSFLGKLLQRVERLEPEEMQRYLVRLAEQKGFFETIFNTLQEGVVVLDGQGRIEYSNRAATRLLSVPEGATAKTPLSRYLRGVPWEELLQEQAVTRRLEINYPERRVLRFYLLRAGGDEMEQEEEARTYVAIFQDVTREETEARETLESERFEALRLLAAGVAHELGNPLNSLDIHLQLIRRDLKGLPEEAAAKIKDSIDIASREIERLDTIIRQFLRAVRPVQPELKVASVADVLDETLRLIGPELNDRDVLVETEVDPETPQILLDPDHLQQAFYNIIKNAMQAISGAGLLRVEVSPTDDWVEVAFTDNGKGIASENLAHVLEPYFTTKSSGSGLGLMIVQRIVREHGGELELESEEGRGTTVRIKLPRQQRRVHLLAN